MLLEAYKPHLRGLRGPSKPASVVLEGTGTRSHLVLLEVLLARQKHARNAGLFETEWPQKFWSQLAEMDRRLIGRSYRTAIQRLQMYRS
jgi:hypothetical protein